MVFLVVCLPILAVFSKQNLHDITRKVLVGNKVNAEMQVEDWRQITKLESEQEAHVSATQAIEKFAILQKPKSRYAKWADVEIGLKKDTYYLNGKQQNRVRLACRLGALLIAINFSNAIGKIADPKLRSLGMFAFVYYSDPNQRFAGKRRVFSLQPVLHCPARQSASIGANESCREACLARGSA